MTDLLQTYLTVFFSLSVFRGMAALVNKAQLTPLSSPEHDHDRVNPSETSPIIVSSLLPPYPPLTFPITLDGIPQDYLLPENKVFLFSYGSNSFTQLLGRITCSPIAKQDFYLAKLMDHERIFSGEMHGYWGSGGVASLAYFPGKFTYGSMLKISVEQLQELYGYEGIDFPLLCHLDTPSTTTGLHYC